MTECTEYRHALGALALGALDEAEAARIREHVSRCAGCSAELRDLEQTVGVLSTVEPDLAGVADAEPPSRVLSALLEEVGRERRRRRLAVVVAAAAIAVLAGVGGAVLGGGVLGGGGDGSEDVPPPIALAAGADAGVEVEVLAWDRGWGTAVQAVVTGVPAGSRCSLVAVAADGTQEIAATWAVPDDEYAGLGGQLVVDGAIGLRSWNVDHYAIVTTDGETLVTTESS